MLKAKQVSTISECARSFYLASSKVGTADAVPYSCSDDDASGARGSSEINKIIHCNDKTLAWVRSKGKSQSSSFKDACTSNGHILTKSHNAEASVTRLSPSQTSAWQHNSLSSVKDGFMPVGDINSPALNLVQSSKSLTGILVSSGIATIGSLPDFGKCRLSSADCSDLLVATPVGIPTSTPSIANPEASTPTSDQVSSAEPSVRKVVPSDSSPSSHNDHFESRIGRPVPRRTKKKVSTVVTNKFKHKERHAGAHGIHTEPNHLKTNVLPGSKSKEEIEASQGDNPHWPMNFGIKNTVVSTHSNPVELVSNKLKQLQWKNFGAESTLRDLHCKLNPFQANQVLKQLQDHSLAFTFFHWLKSQQGFNHDRHTYTTMIGILGQARQFDSAMALLEEMTRNGCQPNVVTYNRLINGYGRANYVDEAMRLFYRMQEEGCEPDHVTFCTLIDVHAKAGYLEVAMDLYRQMLQAGLSPDTFTYSVMIDCLGKAGFIVAAYNLFCEMTANGCVPNLVTYNIMIKMQAKARNYNSALRLYQSMRDAGFRPDKVTYSIVMEILGHCGRLDEAESVFMEMKQDWVPDEPVYGLLVDLWGKNGNPDRARAWYQAMLDAGLRPNVPTCNSLLGAFLRVERFSDAYGVLHDMLEKRLDPSLQTYTLLLSCCTEMQSDFKSCSELMALTGHPAHFFLQSLPDVEPGGLNVRNHVSAFLDLMHCEDRESKRGLVDAVINFLHKSGSKKEAGSVWDVAASRNLYPDAIREKRPDYWLINLHVMSDGTAITALSRSLAWLRRRMLDSKRGPERIDIVTGWGRRSKVTGTSMVRQAVSDLLCIFRSPFYTEKRNSGCFVGSGISLQTWLLQSYVERMHLL